MRTDEPVWHEVTFLRQSTDLVQGTGGDENLFKGAIRSDHVVRWYRAFSPLWGQITLLVNHNDIHVPIIGEPPRWLTSETIPEPAREP